jgi:uncharacterized damage-inducible protein DinB
MAAARPSDREPPTKTLTPADSYSYHPRFTELTQSRPARDGAGLCFTAEGFTEMNAHFTRLYEHAAWANRRVLELLRSREGENRRARELFAHILNAELVWLTRLAGRDSNALPIWSELSLEECAALLEENAAGFRKLVAEMPEAEFSRALTYRNQTGKEFSTAVADILTHVAAHGSYHRGQITEAVKHAGGGPVGTDFILFVREVG